jgi:hypothetical protein
MYPRSKSSSVWFHRTFGWGLPPGTGVSTASMTTPERELVRTRLKFATDIPLTESIDFDEDASTRSSCPPRACDGTELFRSQKESHAARAAVRVYPIS